MQSPRRLLAPGCGAIDNLHAFGFCDRKIIWTEAHKFAILLVEFEKALIAIELGKAENQVPFGQPSKIRTRKFVQWIEKQPVGYQAAIKTGKEIREG